MFSNEFDGSKDQYSHRSHGIIIGSTLMLGVAASLVSARTVAFSFAVIAIAFFLGATRRFVCEPFRVRMGMIACFATLFFLYALLSALWAKSPALAVEKAILGLVVSLVTILIVAVVQSEYRLNLMHMGEGVCIGLVFGLVYLLFELLTDQSIKLWIFRSMGLQPQDLNPPVFFTWDGSRLLSINKDDLTRNIAPAALLMWPAITTIKGLSRPAWGNGLAAFIGVLTAAVVFLSSHESSKLAFLIGLAAFGLATVSLRLTARVAAGAWVVMCLAAVPAALLAHRLDLQNASWLQGSARHRIVIWNYTAEWALKAPWIGIGANATYLLGPELEKSTPPNSIGSPYRETLSIHAHNVYLQTWLELGAIGAVLLTLFGLSVLGVIGRLAPEIQPYGYATFTSMAAMASSSYGMWQSWFVCLFGLVTIAFAVGARLLTSRPIR